MYIQSKGFRAVCFCSWQYLRGICSKTYCAAALVTETQPKETSRRIALVPFINAVAGHTGLDAASSALSPCTLWLQVVAFFSHVEFGLWWFGPRSRRMGNCCCQGLWWVIQMEDSSFHWENRVTTSCQCPVGWFLVPTLVWTSKWNILFAYTVSMVL